MSFVKDKDARTRGVGAIAAVDTVGDRLRRHERIKAARMAQRDVALARLAKRNPLTGLGAINMGGKIVPEVPGGGGAGGGKPPGGGGGGGPGGSGGGFHVVGPGPAANGFKGVVGMMPGRGGVTHPGLPVPPPLPLPPVDPGTVAPPPGGGGVVSGGGGGGTDAGGGLPPDDTSQLPGDEVLPVDTPTASGPNYLLWAGLAFGAYWLFFKKD